ncbi:uncharacterized protein LOC117264016 [Epinephelus lanceolatus]
MSRVQKFRIFVTERLNATLEEILTVFEKTVVKYEEEAALCQEVISRQHALLCALHKPLMDQPTADAFTQQLLSRNEQQDQENPEEPVCAEDQLQVLDETDIIQFTYNPRRPGETADPAAIGTARLKPAGPDQEVQLVSSETEDSDDYSRDSPDPGSASTRLIPKRMQGAGFSCRVCSRTFKARQFLFRHLKAHLQDGEHFDATENMKLHVQTHRTAQKQKREPENQTKTSAQTRNQTRTRERRLHKPRTKVHASEKLPSCDDCGKTFLQVWKKRRHRCVLTRKSHRGEEGGDVTRKSRQNEEGGDVTKKSRRSEEGGDVTRKSRGVEKGGDVTRKSRGVEKGGDVMRKSRQKEGKLNLRHQKFES